MSGMFFWDTLYSVDYVRSQLTNAGSLTSNCVLLPLCVWHLWA